MPFMIGKSPIRRTMKYLEAGKLAFKDNVKIFTLNYNTFGKHHNGAREFAFWYFPQVQFKNPGVQVAAFKNLTPTPFVQVFFDDGKRMVIDIDSKEKEDILNHLISVVGKSSKVLAAEAILKEKRDNPANFGALCERACICEIFGQVPCPGVVRLPNCMRGKFTYKKE